MFTFGLYFDITFWKGIFPKLLKIKEYPKAIKIESVRKYIPAQWPYISSFLIQIGRDSSAAENFVHKIFLLISDYDIW